MTLASGALLRGTEKPDTGDLAASVVWALQPQRRPLC